tara:strand:- start:13606 stop:14478 length:873 start_codon:yes stop_codon:yes gene_type:complete
MILSMTGYGFKRVEINDETIEIEIKSLNSKYFDIQNQIPKELNNKEIHIINLLKKNLKRGKVNLSISVNQKTKNNTIEINKNIFRKKYNELKSLSKSVNNSYEKDLFKITSNLNNIITYNSKRNKITYNKILPYINEAINQFNKFRKKEGQDLAKDLKRNINKINICINSIIKTDKNSNYKKEKLLKKKLKNISTNIKIDENRLEQEILYYIEKQDINEEIQRLKSLLSNFLITMKSKNHYGKKLIFISQEIGREINTIGSKTSELEIKNKVIEMKEKLEKIKEILFNVL